MHQVAHHQGDDRVAEHGRLAVESEEHARERSVSRQRVTESQPHYEHREGYHEPGNRTSHADVEQLTAVGKHRAKPDERPHGPDERRHEWHGDEVRGRNIEVVTPRREVVSQLMTQQNGEQRQREGQPCRHRACQVRRQRVRTREQVQRIVVGDRTRQHCICERRGQERCQKKHDVQRPALPPPAEGPRENEMPPVGLVRPVVAAGPLREAGGERRGGPGVGRMYKRVNDFPIGEGCGPPRDQKRAQVHGAPLTRSAGNPTIVFSYTFELPDSIFDPFTSPPRGFARRRATEQRHTVDIAELKRKSVAELHAMAETLNITNYSGLRKQDLIFRIEQSLLDSDTVLRGEGVLEILPEGYGFLRSPDWNYLYGPDDIYVSPSQIKRFDLRTGDTIMGQVRPPKEGERYL